jgi:hypothetical protein
MVPLIVENCQLIDPLQLPALRGSSLFKAIEFMLSSSTSEDRGGIESGDTTRVPSFVSSKCGSVTCDEQASAIFVRAPSVSDLKGSVADPSNKGDKPDRLTTRFVSASSSYLQLTILQPKRQPIAPHPNPPHHSAPIIHRLAPLPTRSSPLRRLFTRNLPFRRERL